jgi:UDP-glucose 4-epimerase
MKIVVTGSAGFVGTNLIIELIKNKHHIIGLDNLSTSKKNRLKVKNFSFFKRDIRNKNSIKSFFKNANCIIHLAAGTNVLNSIQYPNESFTNNMITNINVLEIAREYNIKKVIFASTGGAIIGDNKGKKTNENSQANPQSPYGAFKFSSEVINNAYSSCYGLKIFNMRFSNVYGPFSLHKKNLIPNIFKSVIKNIPIKINGNGRQSRDFIYIGDVVRAIMLAMKSNKCSTYNVCYGRSYSLNSLINTIKKITKKKIKINPKKSIKGEVDHSILNNSKIKKDLRFKIKYSLENGLNRTWKWYQKNFN